MKINKEGYIIISVTGLTCIALWIAAFFFIKPMVGIYLWIFGALLFIFWLFVMAFFRQPRRVQIHDDELIFSPCDGRVVVTEVVPMTSTSLARCSKYLSLCRLRMYT